jgi:hypothetical protein
MLCIFTFYFLTYFSVKVKCTLLQAPRLCLTAHKGSRGMAVPFLDHGTRRGLGVSITPRPLFNCGKDPVPILQEAVWTPDLVWTGAENFAPAGIRSPDRPARSQSLYRLRYPTHLRTFGEEYVNARSTCTVLFVFSYKISPFRAENIYFIIFSKARELNISVKNRPISTPL